MKALIFSAAIGLTACHAARADVHPLLIQPGAPGTSSRQIAPEKATDLSKIQATRADVEFMQGMIHHHLQAIDMTNLLASNTQNDDMRKLGLRMSISQVGRDQIHAALAGSCEVRRRLTTMRNICPALL